MTNPLLQKYAELHGKKEEPKPILRPPAYALNHHSISTLEGLLRDLKSGKAVIVGNRKDDNYRYCSPNCSPMPLEYFARGMMSSEIMNTGIEVDNGCKITLEIFVKYD